MITKRFSPRTVIALAGVLLAGLVSTHAYAIPIGASLGPIWISGNQTSGSAIAYQLNVNATATGTLISRATISGRGFRATFPLLTNTPALGANLITSGTVTVPTNFVGNAVLRVTAIYNRRGIGSKAILVTIVKPPAAPAGPPPTTLYDVGFNTTVTLNANVAKTNGLGPITSYTWSETSGPTVTLTNDTTATPSFKTLSITNFFLQPIQQADDTYTYVTGLPDGELGPLAISAEQQIDSTYKFRVIISDGTLSSTGTVSVLSATVNRGQNSMPIGQRQYFIAPTNFVKWAITGWPAGSAVTSLENSTTRTPSLRPDKEGVYTLTCSTAAGGVTNTTTLVQKGATYVGVSTCATCHGPNPLVGLDDIYTPWTSTFHATMAQRGVDGILSSHYSESCFACHTLGYDKAASNGGFDDVEAVLGWKFPTILQTGNYATMPAALQNLANIQCESCHGPGSQHPGADSKSLEPQLCASCHQEAPGHVHPSEWEVSPHNGAYLEVSQSEGIRSTCNKCHSPAAFIDSTRGVTPLRMQVGELSCQACHDPHNSANFPTEAHQVRIYETTTLDSGVTVANKGTSALCMSCHNARTAPSSFMTSSPHESTATDILLGFGGVTNVVLNGTNVWAGATNVYVNVTNKIVTANSPHATVAVCTTCHMYVKTDSSNHEITTVGSHTFSVTDRITGEDNLDACNQCHAGVDPVSDFDHISQNARDYDGNGSIEGIQTEVDGLVSILTNKMVATGLTITSSYPYISGYSSSTVLKTAQHAAAYNYFLIVNERSHGVHNSRYAVELLQYSYSLLGAATDGNTFHDDYPAAYIW